MPIRIHFFGLDPDREATPLAASAGIGSRKETVGADTHRYDRLDAEASQYWVAADENDCDLFAYCHSYEENDATRTGALRAKESGKPCLFLQLIDDTRPVSLPYGVVYRESLLASERLPHERVLPAFADDLLRETGGFKPLQKQAKPSVGFCGFVGTPWGRALYRLQGRSRKVLGLDLRNQALSALGRSSLVRTNFVRRTQFWGGAISRFRGPDPDARRRVRQEYLDNLAQSDYVLCLRGAGNFSYRFYETLAMGRVPLFVNTDSQLPFDDAIDWRRHVVWVEQEELPQIGEKLTEFHSSLSEEQFLQLQQDNRKLWEDYLRPTECYRHVLERVLKES